MSVLGSRRERPVWGARDARVAAIARHQRGRLARRQLIAAGLSPGAIGRAVKAGRLVLEHRGVYAVPGSQSVPLGPETAALLAVREGAVLSHHTAGAIWGLRAADTQLIDLLVVGGPAADVRGARVHRTTALAAADIGIRQHLPVTSAARTIIDLTPHLTDRQLEFAVDQAITERLLGTAELRRALERLTRAAGRSRLLELLHDPTAASFTRSHAEERLLALIRDAGLPEPLVNARIAGYEVDFYWPQHRLVVEVDGFQFHSTRPRFERDRTKDAALQAKGISTMRVTWRQLDRDSLAAVVRVAQALARAEAA